MKNQIITEICCGSVDDCITAKRCGADRIELVCGHFLGGLTPTSGVLYLSKKAVDIPILPIIRPRMSGFLYSETEFEAMCFDAKDLIEKGADGLVFGFLKEDCTLDYEKCARFIEIAGDKQTVFHRAIDIVKDRDEAVKQLISLGCTRILTSGGETSSADGIESIKHLVDTYGDKIEIMAGGGIKPHNIRDIISKSGVKQVHFGGTGYVVDSSTNANPKLSFGATNCPPTDSYIAVNEKTVKTMIESI